MKVSITVDDGTVAITGPNDFRLLLGKGTNLTLELKNGIQYSLTEHVEADTPPPPKKKAKLSIVK
jgi:hypothetical protein